MIASNAIDIAYTFGFSVLLGQSVFMGCIMYSDDLLLMSSSVADLHRMLDVCTRTGQELSISFIPKKSCCLVVGPSRINLLEPMVINNAPID